MTPEQQTPASVVEREPVSNPYKLVGASKAFLTEAARYFEARPTGGEDAAHWSNVFNAKNCREAAALIERLSAEREGLRDALEPIARRVVPDHYDDKTLIGWISAGEIRAAQAALAQGGSRQTGVCICVARGDGPEGCGICNETGKPLPAILGL